MSDVFWPAAIFSNYLNKEVWLHLEQSGPLNTKGLAGRAYLAHDYGMLFVFPWSNRWQFWMWDTLIPLDLIYIEPVTQEVGKIVGIVANTTPLSTDTISVDAPARMVIEVNAGWCASNDVVIGNLVKLVGVYY